MGKKRDAESVVRGSPHLAPLRPAMAASEGRPQLKNLGVNKGREGYMIAVSEKDNHRGTDMLQRYQKEGRNCQHFDVQSISERAIRQRARLQKFRGSPRKEFNHRY